VTLGAIAFAATLASGGTVTAGESLLASTIQLGSQTLSNAVPATDLSPIEPFIQAETAMLTTKSIMTAVLCTGLVAGLAGMNTLVQEGDGAAKVAAGQQKQGELNGSVAGDPVEKPAAQQTLADPFGSGGRSTAALPNVAGTPSAVVGEVSSNPFGDRAERASAAAVDGVQYVSYSKDAKPREIWMHGLMDKTIPKLDFPGEATLEEVLEVIGDHINTQHAEDGMHWNLLSDRANLELDGITSLEDVTVVDIKFSGISLESALNIIFQQTTEPELVWEIRDEMFVVTTKVAADERLVTRVYDVQSLLALQYETEQRSSNQGGFGGGGGAFGGQAGGGLFSLPLATQFGGGLDAGGGPQQAPAGAIVQPINPGVAAGQQMEVRHTLVSLVQEMTSPPCQWLDTDGEGGAIRTVGNSLVVRQTLEGHREVVRLLNLLADQAK